jgi:hypothetical protein
MLQPLNPLMSPEEQSQGEIVGSLALAFSKGSDYDITI